MNSSFVFPRRFDRQLPLAAHASRAWIEDTDGKRYLDACGGALVVNVGHGRHEIAQAVFAQMLQFSYVHGTQFTSGPAEELAERLAAHTPEGLNRFYFMSSGSEAVETSVKLARQLHVEHGKSKRTTLISRWKSYHGLTLGALAASGRTYFREPFSPILADAVHIPPPYCLRCSYGLKFPDCDLRCARALEETIVNLGPETVSAFIAEPVSGATLAVYPPPAGYLSLIREICDRYGVFLIFDEVMSGMGRTGKWFACEHEGVVPDIMTLGKGLSSGSIALSAVATRAEYLEILSNGSGNFAHGGTFSHHVVAAAAGLAVVKILERENLVDRAAEIGLYLGSRLENRLLPLPYVLDVRGIGMMWGVEFAQDKESGIPFPRSHKLTERIRAAMYDRGVLVYPATALAGKDGDAVIFGPPFTVEKAEIYLAVETLAEVLEEIMAE